MNVKMWGLILAGAILVAISVIIEVIYSYSLLKPVPWSFYYVPGGTDYAGEFIALIGLILIMAGGYMTREPKE
ncbi:hypothetical protein [Saccharolobus caldissimus]|uniref:Uncharacterized protein n=1 Tax=Saccharolobus caldissimus TaxID=1702097 RepID=A0AAQ4CUK8_9CREN|nr:hypothetical protein [Saccharolobus caldissimus]BDB99489.1 hypothetical protein SACC_25060 [Saccharolobus caldissimus]